MIVQSAIKTVISSVFFVLASLLGFAQNGTEWIIPNQEYYKVKTFQNGVYAIPYTQLQSAGINTADLTNLQMWYHGKEQSILLQHDSLFFLGKKNDGRLDSLLYLNANDQPHTYYSIWSDTAAFFFTVGTQPGKRITMSIVPSVTNIESWYYEEAVTLYTDRYFRGVSYSAETFKSDYDAGEGWFGSLIGKNTNPVMAGFNIPVTNPYTQTAADFQIEAQVVGEWHNTDRAVSLLIGNAGSPDYTFNFPSFSNYDFQTLTASIPNSYLIGKNNITCTIRLSSTGTDLITQSYIKITYPKSYTLTDMQNSSILLPDNGNQNRLITISNVNRRLFLLNTTDLLHQELIPYTQTGTTASVALSSGIKQFVIHNNVFNTVSNVERVQVTLPDISKEYFIVYPEIFSSSAQRYKQYRNSNAGGSYGVELCSFEKLCDLYSYGEFTPLAIKRYCTEIIQYGVKENYLLILGKGINPAMTNFIAGVGDVVYRKNPSFYWSYTDFRNHLVNLVPTYGEPGSDLMFSIDNNHAAQIHTGRIPARTNDEVLGYLDKVQEHESLDSTLLWRKNVLHLSGGEDAAQISLFKKYVDIYKAYVQGPHFGGKVVKTYVKNLQNGAIDDQLISGVADDVNKGISLMTFFGHSSALINDIDIGLVSNPVYGYKNEGKYPMMLVNGCTSANIFSNYSFAEDWINTPHLGAINVLGHTDIGYTNSLNQFSTYFYNFQFNDYRYINKPVGFIHKKVIDSMQAVNSPNDIISQAQITQMNMTGDPALRLYNPARPDYAIYGDNQTADINCIITPVTTSSITSRDPFKIIIPIDNYGSTTTKTVDVVIHRYVNNVLVKNYQTVLPPLYYRDTVTFTISNTDGNYTGDNRFEIVIDPSDSLTEIRKANNTAYINYYMRSSSVKCLYPLNYSIVSSQPAALIVQSTDLLSALADYYFEIDTSKFFNSVYKKSAVISSGSLASWTPDLISNMIPSDSIVYFWRVRFNSIGATEDTIWDNSSFIYIKNSNAGWSQTHIDQHLENNLAGLSYNRNTFKWEFPLTSMLLKVLAIGGRYSGEKELTMLSLNNLPVLQSSPYYNCIASGGMFMLRLDRSSLEPVVYNPNAEGWYYCGQNFDTRFVLEVSYPKNTNTSPTIPWLYGRDSDGMIRAIQRADKNDYLIIFNDGNSLKEGWTSNLQTYFKDSLHAAKISALTDGRQPFLLITKRNNTTPITEIVNLNTDTDSYVSIDTTLKSFYYKGTITTSLIGPSGKWGKMYLAIDTSLNDQTILKLIRYDITLNPLDTIFLPKKDSLELNGTYLTDGVHVYCKLLLDLEDNATLTPPRLQKWQIIYEGVPEGTLNPYAVGLDKYILSNHAEGDSISIKYQFDNISDVDFTKPIQVVYSIRNESGSLRIDTVSYAQLNAKQSFSFTYKFSTRGLVGKNYIQTYVNPQIQPEQYYSNNVLESSFIIEADKTQPVLDVAFDGIRIFDGDLVSASPLINISLKDNNQYLLMTDPASIELYLLYPGQSNAVQITSTNPMVQSWSLENARTNTFVAEIKPINLPDGTYTIIVQGKDASGNKTGNHQYKITFKVENKPSISYFYPYPNPFSTSTRFVFTLSGTTVPENLKIQIMTVSGKIVKEIFKEQLGALHIGNNISDYAWDGTDEFGDRLANGVYLYRVIIKDSNQFFEHRETAGDQAFRHDWGKLYILR